jgi:L-2-hydroxyglutarate oxidase
MNDLNTNTNSQNYDYIIIGGGIIGLTTAFELLNRNKNFKILLIEKESAIAEHSSGRNSGVLHAGFYYTADSLKARFCREGNLAMQRFCKDNNLPVNQCGKLVVAKDEEELLGLEELKRRADKNGVELIWKTPEEARTIDPNVTVFKKALWSPSTATVDPVQVCKKILERIKDLGAVVLFNTRFTSRTAEGITTTNGSFKAKYVINCAGLYADLIAKRFGFSKSRVILPFKGIYLKSSNNAVVSTNVYPVPNLANPFLGVHFTVTVDGQVKIGPTAIPAFWRENYEGISRFSVTEFLSIAFWQTKLLLTNAFNFRKLAWTEIRKYYRPHFLALGSYMINNFKASNFTKKVRPGIRAQLLDTTTLKLVQDFEMEGDAKSLHVLNAVSPAFTCSFPLAKHIVDEVFKLQK